VAIGDFCEVETASGRRIRTQVIGFRNGRVLSMPLEEIDGLQQGGHVAARSEDSRVEVGPGLLGRVIDGFGKPMDGGPAHRSARRVFAARSRHQSDGPARTSRSPCVNRDSRHRRTAALRKGQRIGIFGGSGRR
jgi:flagellar biosynthesis/type III secretory pathway ATPase